MGVSAETLLRDVKKAVLPTTATPSVLGVNDFAFRRGKTYGNLDHENGILTTFPTNPFEPLSSVVEA
jgi:hypothetical protein